MPETPYVTSTQVAHALGVGISTIKRWVDDGVLPAHKTVGGHRKVLLADVLRLVNERHFPRLDIAALHPKRASLPSIEPDGLARQLYSALLKGDGASVHSLVLGAYQAGLGVDRLADHVIAPALHRIGEAWQEKRIDVMHEHRASQQCMAALFALRKELKPQIHSHPPLAIGGAPEQCTHGLGCLLAEIVLLEAGWNVVNLGSNTPTSSFHVAVKELHPKMLWLSVTYLQDAEIFLREYRGLYELAARSDVAVAVGGRALTAEIRGRMPYTTFGDGLTHLGAFARLLYPRARPRPRGRPPKERT